MQKKRRFAEEFKQQAVDLVNQSGVTKRQIAEERKRPTQTALTRVRC